MKKKVFLAPKRLDAKSKPRVEAELRTMVDGGAKEIVFDMKEMEYISSAGLRLLMSMQQELDGRFYVSNVSPAVREIMDLTGLTDVIQTV